MFGLDVCVCAGCELTTSAQIKAFSVFDRYNVTSEQDIEAALLKTEAYLDSLPAKTR